MKRLWPLVALGVGAFIIFAVVTLPASVVLSRLGSLGIHTGGVSGSIWHGRAQVLQIHGARIGGFEWDLHVLPLFAARVSADVKVTRLDGFVTTRLSASPGGTVRLHDLTASLPLNAFPPHPLSGGWNATLNGRFTQLTLEDGWPTRAEGTLDIVDLSGPARNPANVGSYRIVFDPAGASSELLQGAISDAGDGPLEVSGTLDLGADRTFKFDGLIAARPDAPRNLVQALEFLGPPDAQGRRQFVTEGSL